LRRSSYGRDVSKNDKTSCVIAVPAPEGLEESAWPLREEIAGFMSAITADRGGVLVRCPSCGKTNRVRYAVLASKNQCGSCRTPLPPPRTPVEVSDAMTFDVVIQSSAFPVLVDFWAPWCGPCRMMAPELDKLAAAAQAEWLVVKVNSEAVPELTERLRIRSIPTLAVFQGGREIDRVVGARSAEDIRSLVSARLSVNSAA
jgi:thioredoxin 2